MQIAKTATLSFPMDFSENQPIECKHSLNTFFFNAFSENQPDIGFFYIIFIIQPGCCSSLIETLPQALSFLGQVGNSKYFYISTLKK